jgi:hypothetical protein
MHPDAVGMYELMVVKVVVVLHVGIAIGSES